MCGKHWLTDTSKFFRHNFRGVWTRNLPPPLNTALHERSLSIGEHKQLASWAESMRELISSAGCTCCQLSDMVSSQQVLESFMSNKPCAVVEQTHMTTIWCHVLPRWSEHSFSAFWPLKRNSYCNLSVCLSVRLGLLLFLVLFSLH